MARGVGNRAGADERLSLLQNDTAQLRQKCAALEASAEGLRARLAEAEARARTREEAEGEVGVEGASPIQAGRLSRQ